jgi:hypothetical protein
VPFGAAGLLEAPHRVEARLPRQEQEPHAQTEAWAAKRGWGKGKEE